MKIRAVQMEVVPGQPQHNRDTILKAVEQAKSDGIELIIFPEMAVPGYLISDEWERESFINECQQCGEQIKAAADNISIVFGNLAVEPEKLNEDGRPRKYNACFVAEATQFIYHPVTKQPFFIKFLMPNYREFDDNRHFYDPRKLAYELSIDWGDLIAPVPSRLGKLGCMICEDSWIADYNISPVSVLAEKGAELFINISCSPYTYSKNHKRYRVFSEHAARHNMPLIYVNAIGLQDNGKTLYTLDGASCVYNKQGHLIHESKHYQANHIDFTSANSSVVNPADYSVQQDNVENLFQAIHFGVDRFLQRTGIKKIVIGVSGGIDSAVAAAIYRQILPKENLLLVSMPGPFTSKTTRDLAKQLAINLDAFFTEIPIGDIADKTRSQITAAVFNNAADSFYLKVSDFVFENIQARDRSSRILAAVASAFGGAFTCNANKSELTVGYSTLYGDLGGCLAAIGDLWKGEVYQLAEWLNGNIYNQRGIPQGTIDVVPSAELGQQHNVDIGQGDPLFYPYHDRLFRSWVEWWNRATPEDNLRWYLEGNLAQELEFDGDLQALFPTAQQFIADLERWWNLYQGMAIAKRIQAPPILAVKRRAFGFDHRESQLGPRYSSAYLALKKSLE